MSAGKTVAQLAELIGGELISGDGERRVFRVMPTDHADASAITFVTKPKYLESLKTTEATAVILGPELIEQQPELPERVAVIRAPQPYVAFAKAAQALAEQTPKPEGVHPSAVIEPSAKVDPSASIGPFVFVGPDATVGEGAVLYPGVHVEAKATVGAGSVLYNHVVIRHGCTVGARCILHPGVVVGADGFGFAQKPVEDGSVDHVKIPQVGDVQIEDDVEIGANTCIDRGTLGSTKIGEGSKIDNLVQIAHNVQLGPGCILISQSGIAGSSKLGARVILAAQAGISGHLEIEDDVVVGGQAGVMENIPAGQHVLGSPAIPKRAFFKQVVRISKLDSLFSRVKKLEGLLK